MTAQISGRGALSFARDAGNGHLTPPIVPPQPTLPAQQPPMPDASMPRSLKLCLFRVPRKGGRHRGWSTVATQSIHSPRPLALWLAVVQHGENEGLKG